MCSLHHVFTPIVLSDCAGMDIAVLEISLSTGHAGSFSAEARFSADEASTDQVLCRSIPIEIAFSSLYSLRITPDRYAVALTGMLFAHPKLLSAWKHAIAFVRACGLPLHLRIRIGDDAPQLHAVAWELLCDPDTGRMLGSSGWIYVSRSLDQVQRRGRGMSAKQALRSVIVVANPPELPEYGLAPIGLQLAQQSAAALAPLPVTLLDGVHSQPSLNMIVAELWRSCGILVLLAHGTSRGDDTYLWLSDERGHLARVPAQRFVDAIANLPRSPALVVLATCGGGGSGNLTHDATALGVELARSGAGSVVAFAGNIQTSAIRTALPLLLHEAVRTNNVIAAVSATRAITDMHAAGMTRLWCSTRNGVIWQPTGATSTLPPLHSPAASRNTIRP